MKAADIPAGHVVDLAGRWHADPSGPGVVEALVAEGVPEKLAVHKVLRLCRQGLLDFGTSPRITHGRRTRTAWPGAVGAREVLHNPDGGSSGGRTARGGHRGTGHRVRADGVGG